MDRVSVGHYAQCGEYEQRRKRVEEQGGGVHHQLAVAGVSGTVGRDLGLVAITDSQ